MDGFPSLPPPVHSTPEELPDSGIFNCEQLEKLERKYDSWLSELHQCPHPTPVGVRQLGLDEMGMDLEGEEDDEEDLEDNSLEDSEEEFAGMVVFGDDSDVMEDSSVQDNSAFNDSV